MRITLAVSICFFLLAFWSCKNESANMDLTDSGYRYVHHVKNEGAKPKVGDRVSYHEVLYKNDSLLFSTHTANRPREVVIPEKSVLPNPVPPSFEGIMLMSIGDSLTVYQDLDTVKQLPPWLSNEDEIRFSMKLLTIKSKEEVDKELALLKEKESQIFDFSKANIEKYTSGQLDKDIVTTESGLKYIIHEAGTGEKPATGKMVSVNYAGFLTDGKPFDNSFKRGSSFDFPLGQGRVIKGWDEGIALLNKGAKATLFIPYELGYGEAGSPPNIPPKSELVFYVELIDFK